MLKILIVEDDENDLFLLKRQLSKINREISSDEAQSLAEANKYLSANQYDLIIADLGLPDAEGIETFEKLPVPSKTAIIILTGRDDDQLLEDLTSRGIHDFLVKSDLNPSILRRSILHSLKKSELQFEKEELFNSLLETEKMRSLGLMASGISHDFNNKLAILSSDIDLAVRFLEKPVEVKLLLEKMRGTIRQAAALPQKLMALSKNKSIPKERISVARAVDESLELLERVIPKEIVVRLESGFNSDEDIKINFGKGDLDQVLTNLVLNACEAIGGAGEIKVQLQKCSESYIMLRVSDNGRGMSEEEMKKIFDPFYSTKKGKLTSGLGLSMVHTIAVRNSAEIEVSSELGLGTTFALKIFI